MPGSTDGELHAVERLVGRIRDALTAGDVAGMASCWHAPSMVVTDEAMCVLAESAAIEQHCSDLLSSLHARGPAAATLSIQRLERLSGSLASVDIAWSAPGAAAPAELTRYIVRVSSDGEPRICVATRIPGYRPSEIEAVPPPVVNKDDLSIALAQSFPASDSVAPASPGVRVGPPLRRRAAKG